MVVGKIKKWDENRGFGFISRDDGQPDIFAHIKYCRPGFQPTEGLHVEFDVVADERNRERGRADKVREA
jgi:CspA family cold shock protein